MSRIEIKTCPVCGSNELVKVRDLKDYSITKEDFTISRCGQCDFHFTLNPPSEEDAGRYYQSEDYISHSDTKEGFINSIYHKVRDVMLERKYKLVKKHQSGKKLLDIGTGTGYFAGYMKGKGYSVSGVEIDPDVRAIATEKWDINVQPPAKFISKELEGKFNAITLWHVLEHLYDLNTYLERMHQYLEDKGTLVIAVPNYKSSDARHYENYWAAYDVPRHLWHFSPDSIKNLAKKHNFKFIEMKPMPFDPFYNSMMSEQLKGSGSKLLKGFYYGFGSFWKSMFKKGTGSSMIYVLEKR